MAQLDIRDLTIKYGAVIAVHRLHLHVQEGAFVTLLGPSGCGKTTTLRCVAGLEPRSSGEIHIGDEVVSGPSGEVAPEARNVNMVFQTYAVWPHMSVFNNVAFGLRVRRMKRPEVRHKVEKALSLVGLEQFADRYGTELSGGQQQRVALARAIVTEPRLLLFDEPLSNLDASLREQMRFELRELHQRIGKTALYVTHDQVEAMVMSDTVVLMNEGRIVQSGPPEELYERPRTRFAAEFLGTANIWDGAVREARAGGGTAAVALDEDGLVIELASENAMSVGQRGAVGIRAERVRLCAAQNSTDTDPQANRWKGTVDRVAYQGNCLEYHVRVGGRVVRAETPPHPRFAVGETVHVHIPPESVIWLSDEAGTAAAPQSATPTVRLEESAGSGEAVGA